MAQDRPTNRLGTATSPYLLQHAHNPVDWYPWGEEALAKARSEGKPILLSIGYSACHWCHVMARESFEDPDVAAVMNRLFVNVKVDREERPDLDRIYQTAHRLLTRRAGGWPLTAFLSPGRLVPVFIGTYFPRKARYGLPGFVEVMERVAAYITAHADGLDRHEQAVADALAQLSAAPTALAAIDRRPLLRAREALQHSFDPRFGGFGGAPKFPQPTVIDWLLRHYAHSVRQDQPDRQALHMACFTLRRMALGGIYDQVGGGFARYAVDDYWMIPHFEKMLCDNAQLLTLYAEAWHATGDALYARIAAETATWLATEMQAPHGGYCTSVAADSEGQEGRFYLWDRDELRATLNDEEYRLVERRFGLDESPNFEGRYHLHVHETLSELAHRLRQPRDRLLELWESARAKLYRRRALRIPPERDDKILTAWNALAIKAMCRAGWILRRTDWIESARRALDFLRAQLWRDGRLLASWRNGRAELPAYLDDHAFLLDALLTMLQIDWREQDLAWARQLAETLLARFQDPNAGGFYFTADDHEPLPQRPRPLQDEATPAGNSVAAFGLNRLGHLLAEPRYLEAAERAVRVAGAAMSEQPQACGSALTALEEQLEPPELVLLNAAAAQLSDWRTALDQYYRPERLVFAPPPGSGPWSAALDGEAPRAVVCRGTQCSAPVRSLVELETSLRGRSGG